MEKIGDLTAELFADSPQGLLYHYTTLTGLLGIVRSGTLWASDVRYMNDSAELRHTADLLRVEVQKRLSAGNGNADLLGRFVDWVRHRITTGHLLFAASFRSQGNLLSQWRGYSSHGKGVSLGFLSEAIAQSAEQQRFQIGRCIYDPVKQKQLIGRIIDAVELLAGRVSSDGTDKEKLSAYYLSVFESIEIDLLRIAAILKHPSFREEEEWRVVSPVYEDDNAIGSSSILFREANAMLVPYVEFTLSCGRNVGIDLEHLFLGPTSNVNISLNSIRMFLSKYGIVPGKGIDYCDIPYRQK